MEVQTTIFQSRIVCQWQIVFFSVLLQGRSLGFGVQIKLEFNLQIKPQLSPLTFPVSGIDLSAVINCFTETIDPSLLPATQFKTKKFTEILRHTVAVDIDFEYSIREGETLTIFNYTVSMIVFCGIKDEVLRSIRHRSLTDHSSLIPNSELAKDLVSENLCSCFDVSIGHYVALYANDGQLSFRHPKNWPELSH